MLNISANKNLLMLKHADHGERIKIEMSLLEK